MTPQQLIEEFRRQVSDEAQPYLWSDDEALSYVIDAQDQFVILTGGIPEAGAAGFGPGTPGGDLCVLTLTTGQPWSAHSPYVLRIRSGRLQGVKRDVEFISEADVRKVAFEDYGWSVGKSFDDDDTGDVRYGVLGVQDDYVRWMKVPNADDTCRLHIYRLPYPRMVTQDDPLEIDARHHIRLVDWMKYLAYKKQDAETRDDARSKQGEADFKSYCADVKRELERRRYKPRVVQFGGL